MQTLSFTLRGWLAFLLLAVLNLATAVAASMHADTLVWVLAGLGALAALAGGGWWVTRAGSGIGKVETALKHIEQGNFRSPVKAEPGDEFGSILQMVSALSTQLRTLMSDVLSTSRTLSDQAQELDNAAEQLAKQTGVQSEQAQQVTAATGQMSESVSEISRTTQETADSAAQAKVVLRESEQHMQSSRESTSRIVEVVGEARATLDDLNQAVARIGSMTGTIKEIADQTNLLALNAAIEAARAGESGRGFAVVADEVRKLAERTSQSTVDINNNVANIQLVTQATLMTMEDAVAAVSKGTASIEASSRNLADVAQAAERTVEMTGRIADAVKQQSSSAENVSRAIDRMAGTIDNNNREAQTLANAADRLTQTATTLKGLVGRFEKSL